MENDYRSFNWPKAGFGEITIDLLEARLLTACGFGNDYLLLTEGQAQGSCTLDPRSAGFHQIAKDSDSGALVLSGLLNSPDLREF